MKSPDFQIVNVEMVKKMKYNYKIFHFDYVLKDKS